MRKNLAVGGDRQLFAPRIPSGLAAAVCAVAFLVFAIPGQAQQALQALHKHVRPAVTSGRAAPMGFLPPTQRLNLVIHLPVRNQDDLTSLIDRLSDPTRPEYRQWLSVAEFTERFGRTEAEYQKVTDFVEANGFAVTYKSPNRLMLVVRGSVAQIEKAFNVTMRTYQHPAEKRIFYSPDREPSFTLDVPVSHISGLNNYSYPHPGAGPPPAKPGEHNSIGGEGATGSGPGGAFLGSDMRTAYNMGPNTGTGQTVGLAEFSGYSASDVSLYFSSIGQTNNVPIDNIVVDGGSATSWSNANDEGEVCLDIEQAISVAPGIAQLRVYIGPTSFGSGVDGYIFSQMATDNVAKQLSSSWWWSPDDPATDDPYFEEMATQGQTFFSISGDYGAYTGNDGDDAGYPAEDVHLTVVGGTSLTTAGAGGAWQSEVVWNDYGEGSGGGPADDGATYFAIQSWQEAVINSSNGGSTTLRNSPDVALQADFDNYICYDNGSCAENWGGTSFAAPRWAAWLALVNQQVVANGYGAGLGFINPTIYSIGQGSSYNSDFHDITSGNNDTDGQSKYYNAEIGYDLVTGWGSMNGQPLMAALAGLTAQTITFGPLSNQAYGTAPFTVSATASSGLAVSFASTTPAVCTVSGASVTLIAVGTCTIQATQAGNAHYAAAPPVNQSFQVTQTGQTITFDPLSNQAYGTAPFTISATASSGLTVSFVSLAAAVCTLSGNTVTLVAVGLCTIQATQPGNTIYAAAPPVNQSFQVTQATTTTLSASPNPSVFGLQATLTAAVSPSSATGMVTFYDGSAVLGVAPVSNGVATFNTTLLTAGSQALTARYVGEGSAAYTSSISAIYTQTVNAQPTSGFTPATGSPFSVGTNPFQAAVGDFNGDGYADLAVANYASNNVSVLLGNGSGGFVAASGSPFAAGTNPNAVAVGDFNGDGIADLAVADNGSGSVTVLLGNGGGSFAPASGSPFAVGSSPVSVVVGDFNGDGNPDLAVANYGSNNVTVLLGNGSGGFTAASGSPFAAGTNPRFIAAGDFNGDGYVDLAVANEFGNNVTVLLGNGSGGFAAATGSPFAVGANPYSVAVADFNGDGNADLAVANAGSGNVTVLLGNGSGGFTAVAGSPFAAGSVPISLALGDFNGDGKLDLAVADEGDASVTVLLGNGSGRFTVLSGSPFAAGTNPYSVAVADFNGDGRADLALANEGGNNVTILLGADTAAQLQVTQQPSSGTVGSPVGNVVVQVQDIYGNLISGSTAAVTIASSPAGVSGTLTENAVGGVATFSSLVFNAAGSYTLTAMATGLSSATSGAIQITQASQTITFAALSNQPFGTSPFTISATASSGLPVSFTSTTRRVCTVSGDTVTLVAVGQCSIQASQSGNAIYAAAPPVTQNFQVTKASQTITFGSLSSRPFGSVPFTVSATASSGLVVGFASTTTTVCTVSGTTVTLVAVGKCTIRATQSGNADYTTAPPVSQSFQVTKASQTISFGALGNEPLGTAPFTVSATASSGLVVGFASTTTTVCTVSGTTVTLVAVGRCTIRATQPGNADYTAATPVNQSFQVTKSD